MAIPTNLVELEQSRYEDWSGEKQKIQPALAQAQTDLQTAKTALSKANEDYKKAEKKVADLRERLGNVATPADGEPLLDQLETEIIAMRAASAAILSAEGAVACHKAEMDLAQSWLREADVEIAAAKKEWDQAKTDAARRKTAADALAAALLSPLPTKAATLLAGQTLSDAKNRIEADFPKELRNRARERAKLAAERDVLERQKAADVLSLYNGLVSSSGNSLDPLKDSLDDAESALVDFVTRAKSRYEQAESSLKRIGGASNPPLTQAQKDRVNDPALKNERNAAAVKENARDAAALVKEQAQEAYDLEQLKFLADPGQAGLAAALADPNSDVAKAKKALDDATADLQVKDPAFTGAMANTLSVWEAALPDSAWRDLYEFDQANSDLEILKRGGANLAAALTGAEISLVQASVKSDEQERRLRALLAQVRIEEAYANARNDLAQRAAFSALRGDA
jgi:hypothetical protein